jgi:hypothetical protein
MTRNIKALGLALIAVFALGALAAGAQAQTPVLTASEAGTVSVTTSQTIGAESEYFESIGRKLECEKAHFSSTVATKNSAITIIPDYTDHTQGGNCRAGGTLVTTVTEEGCDFVFHNPKTESGQTDYTVNVEIVCPTTPVKKSITIHVRNLLNNADACTITVPEQTAVGALTVKNTAETGGFKDDIDVSGSVVVNTIVHSNNTALCGVEAGKSKEVATSYVINKAITIADSKIGLTMSD